MCLCLFVCYVCNTNHNNRLFYISFALNKGERIDAIFNRFASAKRKARVWTYANRTIFFTAISLFRPKAHTHEKQLFGYDSWYAYAQHIQATSVVQFFHYGWWEIHKNKKICHYFRYVGVMDTLIVVYFERWWEIVLDIGLRALCVPIAWNIDREDETSSPFCKGAQSQHFWSAWILFDVCGHLIIII